MIASYPEEELVGTRSSRVRTPESFALSSLTSSSVITGVRYHEMNRNTNMTLKGEIQKEWTTDILLANLRANHSLLFEETFFIIIATHSECNRKRGVCQALLGQLTMTY